MTTPPPGQQAASIRRAPPGTDTSNPLGLTSLLCAAVACVAAVFAALNWLWAFAVPASVILGIMGLATRGRRRGTAAAGLSLGIVSILIAAFIGPITDAIIRAEEETGGPAVVSPEGAPSEAEPTFVPLPQPPVRQPVIWEGQGQSTTTTALLAGDYAIAWETYGDCPYSWQLDGEGPERLFTSTAETTGRNNVYDISPGDHFIDVNTGAAPDCGWKVTLTPK